MDWDRKYHCNLKTHSKNIEGDFREIFYCNLELFGNCSDSHKHWYEEPWWNVFSFVNTDPLLRLFYVARHTSPLSKSLTSQCFNSYFTFVRAEVSTGESPLHQGTSCQKTIVFHKVINCVLSLFRKDSRVYNPPSIIHFKERDFFFTQDRATAFKKQVIEDLNRAVQYSSCQSDSCNAQLS